MTSYQRFFAMLGLRGDSLGASERLQLPDALHQASDPFVLLTRDGAVLDSNALAQSLFANGRKKNPSRNIRQVLREDVCQDFLLWLRSATSESEAFSQFMIARQQPMQRYVVSAVMVDDRHELLICMVRSASSNIGLDTDLGNIPVGVMYCQQGKIIYANAAAARLFAASRSQFLCDLPFEQRLSRASRHSYQQIIAELTSNSTPSTIEVEIIRMDYEPLWVELSILRTEDHDTIQLLLHSIHRRKKDEIRLTWLSYYDALTELPNRRLFMERLKESLAEAQQHHSPLSIIYFDLDRFKYVNDSLGHAAGDEVLKLTAYRLQQVIREGDLPVRLGGDEFVALLHAADAKTAHAIASKLLFALQQAYQVASRQLVLGGSIGIASYPEDGDDCDTLLRRADSAMYHAKKNHLGIHFFAHEMEAQSQRRIMIEQALIRPDIHHEMALLYQGQYALQDDGGIELIGMEALLRWHHPELGDVSPDEFIPLAEECGQIHTIFPWLIEQCARQAVRWERMGIRPAKLAVNISSTQLMQMDVASEILGRIVSRQAEPSWFELEVTETAMMRDAEMAIRIMSEWVETGISIAMDDYGTGYSSLGYLKRLPINTIKIDRSFIQGLPENEEDSAIVRSTIAIGHTLGKQLLAEGVETSAQHAFLLNAGCNAAQGYLFCRPLSSDMATKYLKSLVTTQVIP